MWRIASGVGRHRVKARESLYRKKHLKDRVAAGSRLRPNGSAAAHPVTDDDSVTAAGCRNLIDGGLKFFPQGIGAIVQAAFQEFNADIHAQFFSGRLDIERQHGACDHVWFLIFQ